ncbi:MAG: hypothetical protein Q7V31_11975 [Parvibaculum sp.]|uniref:hypothetical protein n=1 Tax=Parvibaculum sp. TaxID=2024848 RepID=UPI002726C327|nr:hypothetical protein [Parvibaculum sp.]MDO8839636.1 hypothetical protein [Parvibaculum sp.]
MSHFLSVDELWAVLDELGEHIAADALVRAADKAAARVSKRTGAAISQRATAEDGRIMVGFAPRDGTNDPCPEVMREYDSGSEWAEATAAGVSIPEYLKD